MHEKRNFIIAVVAMVVVIVGASVAYDKLVPKSADGSTTAQSTESSRTSTSSSSSSSSDGGASSDVFGGSTKASASLSDFSVLDEAGNSVKLSSLQGKPTVVGYWATWCPYCVKEAPTIQKLYETYGDRVNFMMIDTVDGTRETIDTGKAWKEQNGYTYPIYFDTTMEASYAGNVYYLPTTYVLKADGSVLTSITSTVNETSMINILDRQLAS